MSAGMTETESETAELIERQPSAVTMKSLGKSDPGPLPEKPMSPFVWRLMLIGGVMIYGSFSVLVHLTEIDGKLPYSSTSIFLLSEFVKLCMSLTMLVPEVRSGRVPRPSSRYVVLFTIPAFIYLITNNMGVQMQTEMDPATYQVLANMKILSTAILYRLIIKRPITSMQWGALGLLATAGICNSYGGFHARGTTSSGQIHISLKGLVMISIYCALSGLAGVYSEYVMKKQYETSIHLQNSLLYVFGCFFNGTAFLVTAMASSDPAHSLNLFHGYSVYTWILIATQASVGLIMSSIMKHGSNITRLFFIGCAMLVTTTLSILIFHLQLNALFCAAFALVLVALYIYHK